jgi:multiple sugar transport system ATP-binding protein
VATIELREVTKRYSDGTEAVSEMSLGVADGEIMILVGPSGCGKSTALRMIAGLEDITAGELRIDGECVNDLAPRDRDIAMVFQSYALYPHMTVRENMGFALKLAKADRVEMNRKVEQAAELLDLTDHLDRKPARMSGGQRQRVAMGRAIVRDPQAFLMDEPLSNLDAKLRIQMRMSIARLQRELGTTTVYVTHDQTEAMTLGDRVAVLRDGVIQQVDTPARLYGNPVNLFVAGFIGSPSINLLPATIEGDSLRLPFGIAPLPHGATNGSLPASSAGREVIAGIRPDHLCDTELTNGHAGRLRFRTRLELVESTGSELYAYFPAPVATAERRAIARVAERSDLAVAEPGFDAPQLTARLDPGSRARAGEEIELAVDPARIKLFDPGTGLALC